MPDSRRRAVAVSLTAACTCLFGILGGCGAPSHTAQLGELKLQLALGSICLRDSENPLPEVWLRGECAPSGSMRTCRWEQVAMSGLGSLNELLFAATYDEDGAATELVYLDVQLPFPAGQGVEGGSVWDVQALRGDRFRLRLVDSVGHAGEEQTFVVRTDERGCSAEVVRVDGKRIRGER